MRILLLSTLIFIIHISIFSQSTEIWGSLARSNEYDLGCIFNIDSSSSKTQIVKNFHRNAGGSISLFKAGNGKYYGVRKYGGKYGDGAIYVVDPITKESSEVFQFNFNVAYSELTSGLIEAQPGELWGMAAGAGTNNDGVIYKFNYVNGNFSIVFDINSISFDYPNGGLVKAPNGKLYGLARGVKNSRRGCIFEIDLNTNTITRRYTFPTTGTMGYYPDGGMVVANGKLYGICPLGGSSSSEGSLFEYDYQTHNVLKRKTFNRTDSIGDYPTTHLLLADNGKLYGSTSYGGVSGHGAIFEYTPGTYTTVKKFVLDSTFDKLSLNVDDGNGRLLGFNFTNTIAHEHSMIVEYFPISNQLNTLYMFDQVFIGGICKDTTNKYLLGSDIVMEFDSTFSKGDVLSMSNLIVDGGNINSPMVYGLDQKIYGYTLPDMLVTYLEPIIFRINPMDYKYEMIKRFTKEDSIWNLNGTFLVHPDSNLYAAFTSTSNWTPPPGYSYHAGIIQLDPKTDSVKLVYKFPINIHEIGSLQLDTAQNFYGVGREASGTVRYNYLFKVNKSLNNIEILHTFNLNTSIFKFTDILIDSNLIIGMYNSQGPKMFKYFIKQDSISTISLSGSSAKGTILKGVNGIYYGLLQDRIIEYNHQTNQVQTIVNFSANQTLIGVSPTTLSYHNGVLYGINSVGPNKPSNSAIYSYDTRLSQPTLTLIQEFDSIDGRVDSYQKGANLIVLEICRPSDQPNLKISSDTICPSGKSIIKVDSSNLEGGYTWALYDDTLAQPLQVDTNGIFTVSPLSSQTYYVKGLANCFSNSLYSSIDLIVSSSNQIYSSESINLCRNGYFVKPSGDTLFNLLNSFIDTSVIQTINTACDSIIYTTVLVDTVNVSSLHSTNVCKYGYFKRPSGDTLFDLQFSFTDTTVLKITNGKCDSIVYTQVLIDTVDVSTSQNKNILTSLNLNANSYQWYDCLFDTLLNVNTRTFNAVKNGSYAVIVTENACKDTSECIQVLSINLPEKHLSEEVHLNPNPTDGKFTLYFTKPQSIQVRIRNMQGKLISEQIYSQQKQIELYLNGSTGIYFIELLNIKGDQVNFKVVKR